MKITKRQLRRIIRESISQNEIQKIEELWWANHTSTNDITGYSATDYPHRKQAISLIGAFGIDPESLKIWMLYIPSGEILNDDFGLSIAEAKEIIKRYNEHPDAPFDVNFGNAWIDDDPGDAPMAYASTVIPSETAVAYAGHTEDDYNRMEDLLHDIFDDKVASFLVPRKKSRS